MEEECTDELAVGNKDWSTLWEEILESVILSIFLWCIATEAVRPLWLLSMFWFAPFPSQPRPHPRFDLCVFVGDMAACRDMAETFCKTNGGSSSSMLISEVMSRSKVSHWLVVFLFLHQDFISVQKRWYSIGFVDEIPVFYSFSILFFHLRDCFPILGSMRWKGSTEFIDAIFGFGAQKQVILATEIITYS